jgi:hypothetical protein
MYRYLIYLVCFAQLDFEAVGITCLHEVPFHNAQGTLLQIPVGPTAITTCTVERLETCAMQRAEQLDPLRSPFVIVDLVDMNTQEEATISAQVLVDVPGGFVVENPWFPHCKGYAVFPLQRRPLAPAFSQPIDPRHRPHPLAKL